MTLISMVIGGLIVKAMTYNMMEIKKANNYWRLTFVVDI